MLLPHRSIEPRDARERLLLGVLDDLWARYRSRVPHVRAYEALIEERGAAFRNDHVAFRTLGCQRPALGLFALQRLFQALGYETAGCYRFPDKKLDAVHLRHVNPRFPKIFVSELRTWELSASGRRVVEKYARRHRPLPASPALSRKQLAGFFSRPWPAPEKADVLRLDAESQFGAWVLLHGYEVNHFTAAVEAQGPSLPDIEATVTALRERGVPMKPGIEGAPGSRLRQSSTEAATLDVPVRAGGRPARLPWTYAYFELAERRGGFDGFLGAQASQLFDMTRRSSSSSRR